MVAPVLGFPAAATGGVAGGWLDGGTVAGAVLVTGFCEPVPTGARRATCRRPEDHRVGR